MEDDLLRGTITNTETGEAMASIMNYLKAASFLVVKGRFSVTSGDNAEIMITDPEYRPLEPELLEAVEKAFEINGKKKEE